MKEIKFRAWDKYHKKMFYDIQLSNPEKAPIAFSLFLYAKHKYEIMQFTGLKDKNRVEIYEGDIVKYGYSDFEEDKTIYQIKYCGEENYPAFDLVPSLGCDSNGLSHAMAEGEIEVIGNIYENPELLTPPHKEA